ncbi:MAG: helix-turn-helix domain-containing protein [Thermoguttaceae bacterium]|nr:helix-turn-helix domain-containing protein [Thermoguttaceae bacterium]
MAYYTLEKTAEMLEMNPGEVNKLREQGKLRAFRDGSAWKFREEDVKEFLTEMIKTRTSNASEFLSSDDDTEGPTMLADSAAFDSMLDGVGDSSFGSEPSGLSLSKDEADDDFKLVEEESPLTDGSTPLTDEHSALVEDAPAENAASPSSVDLAGSQNSDDDLLHIGDGASDSGLSLLDEPDVGGSNVDLGGEDVVLGGGSGSGSSSSGLDLTGDSGLAILGGSDEDFQLSEAVSEPVDDSSSQPASDEVESKSQPLVVDAPADSEIFELADEDSTNENILNIAQDANTEAPTELAVADDSIFDIADTTAPTASTAAPGSSDEESSSKLIVTEDDPFTIDDGSDTTSGSGLMSSLGDNSFNSTGFNSTSEAGSGISLDKSTSESASNPFDMGSTGFASESLSSSPFGGSAPSSSNFGGGSASFAESSSMPIDSAPAPASGGFGPAPVPSTNFTGKDMLVLVPCLLLLILAAIGAWELCRTIWSYEEGGSFAGPVLETIAGILKL